MFNTSLALLLFDVSVGVYKECAHCAGTIDGGDPGAPVNRRPRLSGVP